MKRLLVLLSILLTGTFVVPQSVEKTFYFDEPQIVSTSKGDNIVFEGCFLSALTGQPVLPWKSISLLLPPGHKAVAIEVIYSDFIPL